MEVYLQAEAADRTRAEDITQFYVRNNDAPWCPSLGQETRKIFGPEYTKPLQTSSVRPGSRVTPPPGYSGAAPMEGPRGVAKEVLPARWATPGAMSPTRSTRRGTASRVRALSHLRLLILAALYESWSLPFGVLLSVPIAIFGAFLGLFFGISL